MSQLWKDDAAFVVSADLVLVSCILVLGLMVGLVSVRDQIVQELGDVADAFASLNQSYEWYGITGHTASIAGTGLIDTQDFCDDPAHQAAGFPAGIDVTNAGAPESP